MPRQPIFDTLNPNSLPVSGINCLISEFQLLIVLESHILAECGHFSLILIWKIKKKLRIRQFII